jgi:hypothetical protein
VMRNAERNHHNIQAFFTNKKQIASYNEKE